MLLQPIHYRLERTEEQGEVLAGFLKKRNKECAS
jgi:hypothetical protein